MYGLTSYVIAGLAAVLIVHYVFGPRVGSLAGSPAAGSLNAVDRSLDAVDRSNKGDRLAPAQAQAADRSAIAAVEVVGLRDTAIVYRDRDGRILFRTDPLTNATVVAKDVLLPEVTIRDSGRSVVRPVPVQVPVAPLKKAKLPPGCDPAFSPLTMPSLSHQASRCIAANEGNAKLAGLFR